MKPTLSHARALTQPAKHSVRCLQNTRSLNSQQQQQATAFWCKKCTYRSEKKKCAEQSVPKAERKCNSLASRVSKQLRGRQQVLHLRSRPQPQSMWSFPFICKNKMYRLPLINLKVHAEMRCAVRVRVCVRVRMCVFLFYLSIQNNQHSKEAATSQANVFIPNPAGTQRRFLRANDSSGLRDMDHKSAAKHSM